jgi:uncharacterized protein YgiM (DUF1202 family)
MQVLPADPGRVARARRAVHAFGASLALALALSAGLAAPGHAAADEPRERVQIADPYIEFRTGPGRSYPVFYVAERGSWIEIEMRHTDWFKVRAESGKEGWVNRQQLENTLTEAGSKKTFRDVLLDDYLRRRLEFGAGWGHFGSEPMLKVWTSYNLIDTIAIEATGGQVQGRYSGTSFWHVDLLVQPWSDRRLEPFFGIGVGRINNVPNASLVSAITSNANMANAMVGVRYHITDRLIARLDWAAYTAFIADNRTDQYRALTGGLAFFF